MVSEMTSVYTVAQSVQAPFPPSNDQPPVFYLAITMQQPAVKNHFGNIPDLLQACSYLATGSCVSASRGANSGPSHCESRALSAWLYNRIAIALCRSDTYILAKIGPSFVRPAVASPYSSMSLCAALYPTR